MQWLRSGLWLLGFVAVVCSATISAAQPPAAPPAPPAQAPVPDAPTPGAVAPAPPPAAGEDPADAEEDGIVMNFQDIELAALVDLISKLTGRNFILDDRVKGKVTIISPGKISVDEAYAVFNSVLQVKGFTTVPSGAVIKILPAQEAKSSTVETVLPGAPGVAGDEFITKLIPLDNVDVNNMLGIVQPLVSANGLLAAYTATNTMIIIDSASNIDRISQILRELDVDVKDRGVEVVRLNYAFAGELAATLAQVLEDPANQQPAVAGAPARPATSAAQRRAGQAAAQAGAAAPVQGGTGAASYKIIPDERTNALILVANPLEMRRIKDLIVRLDVPLPFGTGRIHVYYLKHANAYEIVPVLSDLIGGGGGAGGLGAGLLSRNLAGRTSFRGGRLGERGGLGGLGSDFGSGGFGSGFRGQSGFGGGGFGGSTGSLRGRGSRAGFGGVGGVGGVGGGVTSAAGGGGGEFEGEVRITADPSTNALIINASPQDYETLKQVIVQLDVRRRQVYVEAIVMEVRLETQRALGIEMQGAAGVNNGVLLGRVNFQNLNAFTNPEALGSITGLLAAAASNQTIRLPNGAVVPAQQLLITAAETNSDVNILSAPNIVTTDNQEAEIVVGQNVPFIASTSTSETNLGNVFNTIERRDVGITLRITPQISEGGMVRLDIFEEVSALVQNALINANQLGPVTTIRSATTSVVVRDKQTVVIGGLISDGTDNRESSIPFLSDVPVLGNLFRTTSGRREKINLLIFLTPHIIRDAKEHRDKSLEDRDEMKGFMQEQGIRYRKRKVLDHPSWNPDIPDTENEENGADRARGATIYRPPSLPPPGAVAEPPPAAADTTLPLASRPAAGTMRPETEAPEARQPVPHPPMRYVLLAAFAEMGTPPPGLQSSSGLIAVELPADSALTTLFQPGGQYRFASDRYEGYYRVLEAYPTAQEALLVYPEGLPVDAVKGDYLHWRTFEEDATSANATAWTALH